MCVDRFMMLEHYYQTNYFSFLSHTLKVLKDLEIKKKIECRHTIQIFSFYFTKAKCIQRKVNKFNGFILYVLQNNLAQLG